MESSYREKGDTWPKVLLYNSQNCAPGQRAMRHKYYGVWQPHSWQDYLHQVKRWALGLAALGFQAGDRLMIIGDNAPQWYHAYLAAQSNHGLPVGLFSDLSPQEIRHIAADCRVRFAVVEGQEQVDKLLEVRESLPFLEKIIYWGYKGLAHYQEDFLVGYRELLDLGEKFETKNPGVFESNVKSGRADDPCSIVYTAGTTGPAPKGAVHTFRSLRASAQCLLELDLWTGEDNLVPYLPPVWITEQWVGIGCHLLAAGTLNFAEAAETQQRDSRETSPSIVIAGARLWESQAVSVRTRILGADALKRLAYRLLMPIGYRLAEKKYNQGRPGLGLKAMYGLADLLLFRSLKSSLGLSNARICYSTGALLGPEVLRFYHALNIPLKSIYGTTEGGALSGAGPDWLHPETIGRPFPEAEIEINPEGGLAYRHPGAFKEYYQDPETTAEALKDGWFNSGDAAMVRDDGHLVFMGRTRDLLDLPGGRRISPQAVENRLRFSPHIKDAWVVAGPGGSFMAAVVVIDYNNVSLWAGEKRVEFDSFAQLAQSPEVYQLVGQEIERINRTLPDGTRIGKFVNLHKEFDPDEGELTRTRNLRRGFLEDRYRRLTEAIQSQKAEARLEALEQGAGGRTGAVERLRIQSVKGVGG